MTTRHSRSWFVCARFTDHVFPAVEAAERICNRQTYDVPFSTVATSQHRGTDLSTGSPPAPISLDDTVGPRYSRRCSAAWVWLPARWRHSERSVTLLLAFVPDPSGCQARLCRPAKLLGLAVGWWSALVVWSSAPALEVPWTGAIRALAKRFAVSGLTRLCGRPGRPLVLSGRLRAAAPGHSGH